MKNLLDEVRELCKKNHVKDFVFVAEDASTWSFNKSGKSLASKVGNKIGDEILKKGRPE